MKKENLNRKIRLTCKQQQKTTWDLKNKFIISQNIRSTGESYKSLFPWAIYSIIEAEDWLYIKYTFKNIQRDFRWFKSPDEVAYIIHLQIPEVDVKLNTLLVI